MKTKNVTIVKSPIVEDLITRLRDIKTDSQLFRIYLNDISKLLIYEALKDLRTKPVKVGTQTGVNFNGKVIGEKVAFVGILRASLGMLSAAMEFFPSGEFHCLGMKRNEEDPQNKDPHFYLDRLEEMHQKVERVLVMDPMLATGGSMLSAVRAVRDNHKFEGKIQVVCLIAAQKGADLIAEAYPDVEIICAGLDPDLNEHAYIVPGLGDAGDRSFGISTDLDSIS